MRRICKTALTPLQEVPVMMHPQACKASGSSTFLVIPDIKFVINKDSTEPFVKLQALKYIANLNTMQIKVYNNVSAEWTPPKMHSSK